MIKDHPAIGLAISYPTKKGVVEGTVVAVKWSPSFIMDMNTLKSTDDKLVHCKIQPNEGGKCFWTKAMLFKGTPKQET